MYNKVMFTLIISLLIAGFCSTCQGKNVSEEATAKPGDIVLKVFYSRALPEDSLVLAYSDDVKTVIISPYRQMFARIKAVRSRDNSFTFNIPKGKNGNVYVFLNRLKTREERENLKNIEQSSDLAEQILPYYILGNGDSLTLHIYSKPDFDLKRGYRHNFYLKFSGTGAKRQNLWNEIDSIAYHESVGPLIYANSYKVDNFKNQVTRKVKEYLQNHQAELSQPDYDLLLAHGTFSAKYDEVLSLVKRAANSSRVTAMGKEDRNAFKLKYDSVFTACSSTIPKDVLQQSMEYLMAEFYRNALYALLSGSIDYRDRLFEQIKTNPAGVLRDNLFAQYFLNLAQRYPKGIDNLDEAKAHTVNSEYKSYLNTYRYAPGSPAFNFTLLNAKGEKVSLSDFKGKVVLVDFWYTGCGGCMLYYNRKLSPAQAYFKNDSNVVFITVSIDKSKPFWLQSIKSGKYTSEHVINLYTDGKGNDHEVIPNYGVNSFPRPVLIGKDQRIIVADDRLRSYDEIIKQIKNAM